MSIIQQQIVSMQVYLVGGAVRDKLLHRKVTERDWVVVGATPAQLLAEGYTQVGKDFPVFLHPQTQEEYALARTERKTGGGYTGFSCHATPDVTLEEDLLRRDLTINAMAESASGELIDPYNGQADLQQRLLRHVSAAFSEDPLRIFRVARFAARYAYLGFSVAEETMMLMQTMAASDDIRHLSAERVWQETRRALMEDTPEVYLRVLQQCGALKSWMPELEAVIADESITASLQNAAASEQPLTVRWATVCWPLEHPALDALQKRLKVPNQQADCAQLAVKILPSLAEHIHQSKWLLEALNTCDAWRRPERLECLMPLFTVVYPEQGQHFKAVFTRALAAANQVDVKAIIAAGYQGPDIKQQLSQQRLNQIEQCITNHGV
ncbi:MAG: CCA tRNA nucleotidyltransferase [Pseudomonadota bacterium]|nr:CCA tRNA nucleotidyltransferase [Pseudomonadota bacterium]